MVGNIVGVGALSMCDLKAVTVMLSNSETIFFHKIEPGYVMEATKNICCVKGEGAV